MSQQRTQQASRQGEQRPQQGGREERAMQGQGNMHPVEDVIQYVREYTRERPESVAMACFAVGFILGWRLKPW